MDQLGKLKSLLSEQEKKNVQILAVSLDTHEESYQTVYNTAHTPGKFDFPLLEDKGHKVVDLYGIRNPAEVKTGLPYPVTYIINKDGIVTRRFLDTEKFLRPSNDQIREELKKTGALH